MTRPVASTSVSRSERQTIRRDNQTPPRDRRSLHPARQTEAAPRERRLLIAVGTRVAPDLALLEQRETWVACFYNVEIEPANQGFRRSPGLFSWTGLLARRFTDHAKSFLRTRPRIPGGPPSAHPVSHETSLRTLSTMQPAHGFVMARERHKDLIASRLRDPRLPIILALPLLKLSIPTLLGHLFPGER